MVGRHSLNKLSIISVILSQGKFTLKVLPLLGTHKVNYTLYVTHTTLPVPVTLNS